MGTVERSPISLYRRTAIFIVPFLMVCYLVAMIDRLNIGYAKLQFMSDLSFDEAVFGMAAGILYIGYIIFEVPSNLLLERFGIRVTLLRIMTVWGVFTMALAFAANQWSFYFMRFMIGAAEAGFFPGILFYLTLWFPRDFRARITSLFAVAVPVSGVIGAPVSSWIMTHMSGLAGLKGWQWLFLIEGAPAILLGLIAYFFLSDRPSEARFLSKEDKDTIARNLESESPSEPLPSTFAQAMRDRRVYFLAFVYFGFFSAQSVLLLWVPTLLRNAGVATLSEIGWRSSAIFLAGALGMVALSWNSDRMQERRWHLIICGLVASAAYLLLPFGGHSPDLTSLILIVASIAIFAFLSIFWTVPAGVLGKGARAGGIAFVSSLGASGSALSPTFIGWMKVLTGSLFGAIAILAIFFCACMVVLFFVTPPRARSERGIEDMVKTSDNMAKTRA